MKRAFLSILAAIGFLFSGLSLFVYFFDGGLFDAMVRVDPEFQASEESTQRSVMTAWGDRVDVVLLESRLRAWSADSFAGADSKGALAETLNGLLTKFADEFSASNDSDDSRTKGLKGKADEVAGLLAKFGIAAAEKGAELPTDYRQLADRCEKFLSRFPSEPAPDQESNPTPNAQEPSE